MIRRLLPVALFVGGVTILSTDLPAAQQTKVQKPAQKKPDDKKKADPPKKPDPKPAPTKPTEPESEETFDPSMPTNPFDLARGLREQGLADLAVEYLQSL